MIYLINWSGFIISFALGYFYHKKKEDIYTFIKSMILFYKIRKDKNYNDFFECDFKESDFVKESDSHDE